MSDGEALAKASESKPGIIVGLEKPVMAHGEMVSALSFREPTGGDIEKAGLPITIDFENGVPRLTINTREMGAMMSELAAVPPSAIKMLSASDWSSCAWKLSGFFVPRQQATPS